MSAERVIVIYGGNRHEIFSADDVEYFIRRRISKEGIEPEEAYCISKDFDFKSVVADYYAEGLAEEAQRKERKDREEYERLKKKYDKS